MFTAVGASQNPCDITYAGPTGSSELEAKAITNYVISIKSTSNMMYYFAFHSYSQMILVPYSHVTGVNVLEAENYGDLVRLSFLYDRWQTKRWIISW